MRFPGFDGEWESITVGETGTIKNGPFGSILHAEDYVENGIPIVTTEHFKDGTLSIDKNGIPQVSEEDYERLKGYKLSENDIVFSRVGSVDVNAIACKEHSGWLFSGRVLRIRPNGKINPLYLHYALSTNKVRNDIKGRAVGQTMPSINTPILSSTKIKYPNNKIEQERISVFLSILDERIATQNKIIEDYRFLISSIMKKVFHDKGWKEVRLGGICERVTRKNSNNESNLVLTIAAQYGLVSQTDFFNKSVASDNLSNYFLLQKGDFAYNKSYSGDYTWGAIKRLDLYETGVLSPLYICFRPKDDLVDSDFLTYLFESKCWYREVAEICVEGARNHGLLNVSVNDFFNLKLHIPSLSEQKEIATMMKTFTNKIEESQRLLSLYTKQKQYLLNTMFV